MNSMHHVEDRGMEYPAPCVELHGSFDGKAARGALEAVQRHSGAGAVLLDFSKVDVFHDLALAILVQGLSRVPEVQLRTRGLPSHPARLLQYLHIDPHTLGPMAEGSGSPARSTVRWNSDLEE